MVRRALDGVTLMEATVIGAVMVSDACPLWLPDDANIVMTPGPSVAMIPAL